VITEIEGFTPGAVRVEAGADDEAVLSALLGTV
jgi:hypothetical protein